MNKQEETCAACGGALEFAHHVMYIHSIIALCNACMRLGSPEEKLSDADIRALIAERADPSGPLCGFAANVEAWLSERKRAQEEESSLNGTEEKS